MAIITYPLTPPSLPGVRDFKLVPSSTVARARSPFTKQEQIQVYPGQLWLLSFSLPPILRRDTAAPWLAFLKALNGSEGTFLFGDPFYCRPRGVATGTPQVDGAAQTGRELNLKGMTAGVTGIFKADDFIQLGSGASARLHSILADANSDGAGKVKVAIWPALRESPVDGAAVTVENCKGVFRLDDNVPEFSRALKTTGISVSATEVLA